jgi:divalent metal cation (Fe/Co/Zn/Cd) transporter
MRTKASTTGDRPSKADDIQNHSLKSRAAGVSIASNATLIAFKLAVGIMSGSIAIISAALHPGSDLVAALIAFWSVRHAS